jgi:ectoine hydroxylase
VLPDLVDLDLVGDCLDAARIMAGDAIDGGAARVDEPADDGQLRSLFEIHRHHDAFARLVGHPVLSGIARQLLGSDVYMHQSRLNLKRAFSGRGFPWHSDFETWHVEDGMPAPRAVSCSLALTENGAHNGPLMVIGGSHRWYVSCPGRTPESHHLESLRRQEYGVPDEASLSWLADQGPIHTFTGGPGTAVFFECNAMHGSADNITPQPRTNAFFVYNSIENQLVDPFGTDRPRPEHLANRTHLEPVNP